MGNIDNNYIDFKVGTDIEFLMFDKKGNLIKSNDYVDEKSDFGADANGRNWEVRSVPSLNPIKVVNSVKTIMQDAINNDPNYFNWNWIGRSFYDGLPMGTHIHFGLKQDMIDFTQAANCLDNYLGCLTLLLEDKTEGVLRRSYNKSPAGNNVSYGKMGDIRKKKHGFEYRTPSSCISSPHALKGLLCLGKTIIFELLNNQDFIFRSIFNENDFIELNTKKVRSYFPKIWADIQSMALYPVYKKHIDYIHYLIVNNLLWYENDKNLDFKASWGLKNLNNKAICKENVEGKPILNKKIKTKYGVLKIDEIDNLEEYVKSEKIVENKNKPKEKSIEIEISNYLNMPMPVFSDKDWKSIWE